MVLHLSVWTLIKAVFNGVVSHTSNGCRGASPPLQAFRSDRSSQLDVLAHGFHTAQSMGASDGVELFAHRDSGVQRRSVSDHNEDETEVRHVGHARIASTVLLHNPGQLTAIPAEPDNDERNTNYSRPERPNRQRQKVKIRYRNSGYRYEVRSSHSDEMVEKPLL